MGRLSSKQEEVVDRNIRNAKRLGKLIDDLLDLSRLKSGRTKIERREVDLSHLIHEVIQNFQPAGKEGGTSICEEIAANLGQKIKRLQTPRNFSVRPVLIHVNGVAESVIESDFFSHIIDFGELLISPQI